jgi:cytidine deaminase
VKQKKITIPFLEFSSETELSKDMQELALAAKKVSKNAYSPYSKFKVGAAILLENGKVISGSNQENSAYPSGLCAERVALFYANSLYPKIAIKAIAVVAFHNNHELDQPVYPCGACRQVIIESQSRQEKPIKVMFIGKKRLHVVENASYLLPLEFDKESLNS